jgi:hypothetical protein
LKVSIAGSTKSEEEVHKKFNSSSEEVHKKFRSRSTKSEEDVEIKMRERAKSKLMKMVTTT